MTAIAAGVFTGGGSARAAGSAPYFSALPAVGATQHGGTKLVLTPRRSIAAGSYTLTLIHGRTHRHETVAIP